MSRFLELKVTNIIQETSDCVSIVLDMPESIKQTFRFNAGQYLTFKKNIHNQEVRRSYSLSSSPHENIWKVSVKKVENGLFSTYVNHELKIGDVLEVMPPEGKFVLPNEKADALNYVFFASGSGITPIMSIIKCILHSQPNSNVVLIYGNKTFDSIMFREELEDLKNQHITRFSYYHVLSREILGNELLKGRITSDKCEHFSKACFSLKDTDHFYICGPYEMIMMVKDWLLQKGIDKGKIHFELFGTPLLKEETKINREILPEESKNFKMSTNMDSTEIEIIMDGDKIKFTMPQTEKSILDYAYDLGHDLPFSCKGGVCCTCKAKVLEGKVSMKVNYSLEDDEVAAGYVLTCQSKPESQKVLLSFDE